MPTIKPFRDYDEHEVVNLFRWSGAVPTNKGTFCIIESGWRSDVAPVDILGTIGAAYRNTVSPEWVVPASVSVAISGSTNVFGMLLYDVRGVDENNESLQFHPRKQHELQCVLSGQAVPILTRGVVLYSGILGTAAPGNSVYIAAGGVPSATGTTAVGKVLGEKDANGWQLLKINL